MTTISQSAHARPPQPRALIVTIYGLYAREASGWLSIAALIQLLAELGVEEAAVRSAVSRLKSRGILEARPVGGAAGYALSASAREILDEGDRRIFQRRRARPDEGWLLAVFSVPESERSRRHLLRSRLTWLGFGTVAPGVRVAPAHVESEARSVLARDELSSYVDLFRAERVSFGNGRDDVAAWWDLEALRTLYDDFLTSYQPMLASSKRRRRADDAAAYVDYSLAVTSWRRLPFLDPGLAEDMLPTDWPGADATALFFALHDRLAEPAHRYVAGQRQAR